MKKIVPALAIVTVFFIAQSIFARMGHDEHHGHGMMQEGDAQQQDRGLIDTGNKICPVSGELIDDSMMKATYEYDGKIYNFCCAGCIDEFNKDPQKYISKIKEFKLEAYQFGYSPERIEVKKGDIVKIYATSRDVPHGIYIKEYDINATMKKGGVKKLEFLADKKGEFPILCSVYCGRGHQDMKAILVVEE